MKLYYSPGACSLSPHIVLREAGLPFELERVDLKTKMTAGGIDYTSINPKGYVPALALDDGQVLTEGPAIVQYLADRVPEKKLAPANGTLERYRLQEWLNFISTELHKGMGGLFNANMLEDWRAVVKGIIARRLDYLAKQLEGNNYLMGESFTVADAYLFTILGWSKLLAVNLAPWPVLKRYTERVAARPAVHEALVAEGLVKS